MAQILIRDLDAATVERLKARAREHGRSLQSEARLILEDAAGLTREDARRILSRWQKSLAGRKFTESAELIREDRQR